MTHADVKRVTNNKNTKVLIDWLASTIKISSKYIVSTQFFHSTHSAKDRVVLVALIKDFFKEIDTIDVEGDGVLITLK
jgi:hydrogenase-4 membrane subunit HyfE